MPTLQYVSRFSILALTLEGFVLLHFDSSSFLRDSVIDN